MKFFSTNRKSKPVGFREAVIKSLPDDRGLYFPDVIPIFSADEVNRLKQSTLPEIGAAMMLPFVKDEIAENRLYEIMQEVLNFEIPVKRVSEHIDVLELFHGPTYAFKDVGARFLARCLGEFSKDSNKETTILVATSGDTGGAVANGFYGVEGVNVIILYPSGKVSDLQEKQLTTLGGNITALEIDGDFDRCQAMVKDAFLDAELNAKFNLTSANSINIARWMPQSIYYAWMGFQLDNPEDYLLAVPSGNYGNISAGMLAKKMGFPIGKFIACSNANDVVPRYIETCEYRVKPTIPTHANAMDVSDPSNFPRIQQLYGHSYDAIKGDVKGFRMGDEEILKTIHACAEVDSYTLDPHGAIGYQGLKQMLKKGQKGVFLETAHPIKFTPVMEKALNKPMSLPDFAIELMAKKKTSVKIKEDLKSYLMDQ